MSIKEFFKKAFSDMKESTKQQHEVDKANFKAAKAEAKASFEENKFHNSYKKAKATAKKSWDEAHMSVDERKAKMQEEREKQIAGANERKAAADERIKKDPAPFFRLTEYGTSALHFTLRGWVDSSIHWDVRFDLLENIYAALRANGLQLPYDKLDLRVANVEEGGANDA